MPTFKLLTAPSANAKLNKANNTAYYNVGLSLAPAHTSGYQVCPSSSEGCRSACLAHVGRAEFFRKIMEGRIRKTKLFFEQRSTFLDYLKSDLTKTVKYCESRGLTPVCRLNVFSDIQWEAVCPDIFSDFPQVQFYDYTKIVKRCYKKLPANYHLTFSRNETTPDSTITELLKSGVNVAVPFYPTLPKEYLGFPVFNGDQNDLRFLDPVGHIVGLLAKLPKALKKHGEFINRSDGFIVQV